MAIAAPVRRVLVLSTYELGHQPFLVATAASFLRAAGHHVRAQDLAMDALDPALVDWADAVAVAVPMHTATRLAGRAVRAVRERRGAAIRVVLVGLYASHGAATLPPGSVDAAIGGEFEAELVRAVEGLPVRSVVLDRLAFPPPARDLLPSPSRYARLLWRGEERPAGYVEASRGCVHGCRHCPVPVVYDRRIRVLPVEVVADDVASQWDAGVRHLTLGDPDALNAPVHTLRVLRAAHARHPDLTIDITTKVEHVLRHGDLLGELRSLGCILVTTAVETVDEGVLRVLDKGHSHNDTRLAVRRLRSAGIEVRPSLLPFTPWSSLDSHLALLDWVAGADLVDSVDPVQLSIRLLVPDGSLLLGGDDLLPYLTGTRDASGHAWRHPDPRMDDLAGETARIAAAAAEAGEAPRDTHARMRGAAARTARQSGREWSEEPPVVDALDGWLPAAERPRLSEAWFCCAEPTPAQLTLVGALAAGAGPGAAPAVAARTDYTKRA